MKTQSISAWHCPIRWDHLQADLIDDAGFPYTTSLGDGRIYGLELEGAGVSTPAFALKLPPFSAAVSRCRRAAIRNRRKAGPARRSEAARMAAHL